jgi:hypothetical protein
MSKSNGSAVLAECEEILPINSENAEFKNYYELPFLRYGNIFMFIVAVDTIVMYFKVLVQKMKRKHYNLLAPYI